MRGGFLGAVFALLCWTLQPVLAQNGLPPCAATCFQSAVMNQTACGPTDIQCICTNAPLQGAISACVAGTCTVKQTLVAVNTTQTMCGIAPRDRSVILFRTSIAAGAIALFAVIVRTSVAIMQHNFGLDDVFCLLAEAACIPTTVMQTVTPGMGFGRDTWGCTADNIYTVLKLVYASQVSYFPCSGFTKLCFLFFFMRIFPSKLIHKVIYAFIAISGAYTIGFGLTIIFGCSPISATWTAWDGEHSSKYCINQNLFYLVAAGFNIGIDVAIVLIPIPELWKLKLSIRKKIFLFSMFSVGGVTIVVSCIRLSALAIYATSTNPMYDNMMAGVYSVLEMNVGIICICMPSFRRFLAILVPKCFGTTANDSNYKQYEDGTPNARISSKKRSERKRSTLDGSLFNTTIMKTIDTKVEAQIREDDEVHLVELQKNGKNVAGSNHSGNSHEWPQGLHGPPEAYHGR